MAKVPRRAAFSGCKSPAAGRPASSTYSKLSVSTGSVSTRTAPPPAAPISQYFTSPWPGAARRKKRVSWLRSGSALNASRSVTSRSAETSTCSTLRSRRTRSNGFSGATAADSSAGGGAAGGSGRVVFHTP